MRAVKNGKTLTTSGIRDGRFRRVRTEQLQQRRDQQGRQKTEAEVFSAERRVLRSGRRVRRDPSPTRQPRRRRSLRRRQRVCRRQVVGWFLVAAVNVQEVGVGSSSEAVEVRSLRMDLAH